MRGFLPVFLFFVAALSLACGPAGSSVKDGPKKGDDLASGGGGDGADESGGDSAGFELVSKPPSTPWVIGGAFTQSGDGFAYHTADGALHWVDTTTGTVTDVAKAETGDTLAIADGAQVFLAWGSVPKVVDVKEGVELLRLNGWKDAERITISPNGVHMLVLRGSEIGRWNLPEQASGSKAGERVQDFINRQLEDSKVGLPGPGTALHVSNDSSFVVASNGNGKAGLVQIWRPSDPTTMSTVGRTNGSVVHLALSPDGKHVLAINDDGQLTVAATDKSGFQKWSKEINAKGAEWTDGGLIIVHKSDGTTEARKVGGEVLWSRPGLTACWSRGNRLACATRDRVVLLRTQTGEMVASTVSWDGQHSLWLSDGTHVGTAPGFWFDVSDDDWSGLASDSAIASALAAW